MSFEKVNYTPGDTLPAEQVNAIQDAIIDLEDNKLPKSGGTLTGNQLGFNNKNSSIYSGDKWVEFYNNVEGDDESNRSGIRIQSDIELEKSIKSFRQVNGVKTFYDLFGGHNKPMGTYVGNGSTNSRAVNIGGLGYVVFITTSGCNLFVTSRGAIGFTNATVDGGSNVKTFFSDVIVYTNGKLQINGDDAFFNANNVTYWYQVL